MPKLALTIIIITHRSNKSFIKSLKSAQFADQILIIDNNSNNNWKKLKLLYSFEVMIYKQQINNFAAIRNQAMNQAKYNWIFFLDSDEIIENNSINTFKKIVNSETTTDTNAFLVKRIDYFLGHKMKWGEVKNVWVTRLIKKNKAVYQRAVHEIVNVQGLTKKTAIKIQHLAHNSINEFLKDISNYASIEADYRIKITKKISKLKIFGQMLFFPSGKFIVSYFMKLGFLDGMAGLIYAVMMSIHSMAVRIFIYEKIN